MPSFVILPGIFHAPQSFFPNSMSMLAIKRGSMSSSLLRKPMQRDLPTVATRPLPRSRPAASVVCRAAAETADPTPKELAAMKREKETQMYLASAAYMKSMGFINQAELARVLDIATNPDSLFVSAEGLKIKNANARPLDAETDIQPIVQFLQSKGVQTSEIREVISGHPPVLSYHVARLEQLWTYLESLGVADIHKAITTRPSLLGLDVDANLKKIVGYLQSVDTPPETIVK